MLHGSDSSAIYELPADASPADVNQPGSLGSFSNALCFNHEVSAVRVRLGREKEGGGGGRVAKSVSGRR